MAGLSAADTLRAAGRSVLLIESAPMVGGLARAIRVGGEPIEPYYHHIFPQDSETAALVDVLRMNDHLEWWPAPMAVMHEGHAYPFNSPLDLLRFAPLSPFQRVRLGAGTSLTLIRRDHARLDRTPVGAGGPALFGATGYATLWQPLFEAKFGPYAERVPMAWLAARIRQRGGGRRATGDRLGYLRGSLGSLAEAYAAQVAASGVDLRTSTRVLSLTQEDGDWVVAVEGANGREELRARSVVACLSGPILSRLIALPAPYAAAIDAIPYRGIVCVLLELRQALSPYYWVNVTDRLGLGCVGIIEHTNFVPPDRYGGRSLVYLAHYVDCSSPTWLATVDEIVGAVVPAMHVLNPAFQPNWIVDAHLNRDPFAQPVPQVGGPMSSLPMETGLSGLIHASLAHVYPDDRGVSKALGLGRGAAALAVQHLGR